MDDRHPDAHRIHPPKISMSSGLASDAVEGNEDRQPLTCSAYRIAVLLHRRVSPAEQHVSGLMSLRCQDQNVVDVELDLVRTADRRQPLSDIFIRRPEP